ncbi:MAG: hypothetical protein N2Z22_12200, partial [Turneriella sp.]|nr:hypothetical protein [Turneriella sp.]
GVYLHRIFTIFLIKTALRHHSRQRESIENGVLPLECNIAIGLVCLVAFVLNNHWLGVFVFV